LTDSLDSRRMMKPDHASLPPVTEAFASSRQGAATGFVLAQLDAARRGDGPVLWVQDRLSAQEGGMPCIAGLSDAMGRPLPLLHVAAKDAAQALWAMEEGLECAALSAVIGEVWGSPRALDFTATKRLALRAGRSGVPLWLIRADAEPGLSVAPDRWRLRATASSRHPFDPEAPGAPLWSAELFRSRRARPGAWVAGHDRAAHRVDLAAPLLDRPVGADAEGGAPAAGPVGRTGT
jgi:protein ImuA